MNKLFAIIAVAFVSATGFALTPSAVWDCDVTSRQLNTTQGVFRMSKYYGNPEFQDGKLIIGSPSQYGVGIALPSNPSSVTVLIKYSNFAVPQDPEYPPVFMSALDSGDNVCGVRYNANDVNNMYFFFDQGLTSSGGRSSTGTSVGPAFSSIPASGYAMLSYSAASGTRFCYGSAMASLSASENAGYHFSGRTISNVMLNGTLWGAFDDPWPNIVIEKVALFTNQYLSASDVSDFIWPSEIGELSLDGTDASWSSATWKNEDGATIPAPTSGAAIIELTASTTLTIDTALSLGALEVRGTTNAVLTLVTGDGSFVANVVTVKGGVLKQGSGSVLGATSAVYVEPGGTFDMNGLGVNSATKIYLAGAGAGDWPWALTSSGGAGGAVLGGVYLTANATIGGANELKIGTTSAGYYCYLQGFTLTKTGAGALTGTNMNTPGTGTIDLQGGDMTVNQWNNLNNSGGSTTVILNSGASLANNTHVQASAGRAIVIDTLQWQGGALNTADDAFKVNTLLRGAGSTAKLQFASGATASLTGDLTVTTALTLDGGMSFDKDSSAASDVAVNVSGSFTGSGAVSVGAGVTLNLGTSRPGATFTVDADGAISAKKVNSSDVPQIKVSSQPAHYVLYDENGDVVDDAKVVYDSETGTMTFYTGNTWTATNGNGFDTAANWSSGYIPSSGDSAAIQITGDTEITVNGSYDLSALTITGQGKVSFAGSGSIASHYIYLQNGASLLKNGTVVSASVSEFRLDAGTKLLLNGVTEQATISGAGAVETYGDVTMAAANTFTGGITAKTGTLSTTVSTGFGPYVASTGYASLSRITVEDGACLDLNGTRDYCFALTIAGKGVDLGGGIYSGAVKNSSETAFSYGNRQTASLTLTADALVDVSTGWGIIQSAYDAAYMALNGHTLTIRGTGTFPMANVNASNSSGTIILDGANLQLYTACNLSGIAIVAKGCSTIDFLTAPSALGSLTIQPAVGGTTASHWNLPSGLVPVVNAANIEAGQVSALGTATIFTAPSGTVLSSSTINASVGSRYTATISGNTVSLTEKAFSSFFHYDFNAANSIASDSLYNFGNINPTFVAGKNGTAGWFKSGTTPWWNSNTAGVSPFYAGQMTVTAVIKPFEASNTIIWNLGSAFGAGIALVAKDSSTLALVSWTGGANGADLVSVADIPNLADAWHFVAVVAGANGTTLYVDGLSGTTSAVLPLGITQVGQLGSIHGNAKNYVAVGESGFLLDDLRVYDAALTVREIRSLKKQLNPDPTRILLF